MKYRRNQNVGLFDKENTLQELHENGNPLPKLKEIMDFEQFRSILEPVFGRLIGKYRVNNPDSLSGAVDMAYGYCDDHQPHAVRRIYDSKNLRYFDFRWDGAGNLGQVSAANESAIFESGRFLYWTEDSRMHAAVDDRYYSYYAYDHGGERRLKLTGDNKLLDVNADFMATYTILNEQTLYPSAYMVLTNRGYTKHYYAGAERVAARLGGGGLNAMGNAIGYSDTLLAKADTLFGQSLEQVNSRALNGNDIDCILGNGFAKEEFGHPIDGIPCQMQAGVDFFHDPFKDMVHSMLDDSHNGQEREVYFYHSDHLGSASWITDSGGQAIQHLQYLPYGEPYINQRTSGYNERFTFTGKERDEETGYGYFGARYMDYELMTMWLSVDPMADKYPSLSPYSYCAWNPVRLVDPDGKEIVNDWVRRADGTIYWDPNAKSPASTKKGETYLGKKGATYDRQTNEVTLYRENGTTSKFQSSGPMTDGNYTYPIDIKSDTYNNSRSNPSALYGSRRGERKHAGCDLYAPEGTAVFSITKGTVMSVGRFYKGTDEIAINHNSFIGRYCELIPSFDIKPGCKVNSGDFLGVIVSMPIKNGGNNSMLHFEMYLGNASGKLTNRNNPPFERRSDLKNPTMVLNNLIAKTWSF